MPSGQKHPLAVPVLSGFLLRQVGTGVGPSDRYTVGSGHLYADGIFSLAVVLKIRFKVKLKDN